MLTRHEIVRRADDDGVDAAVAERDYVLAHIVAQLHRATPADGARLVFKGGTALRLVHVGADYRYSADLDFSVIDGSVEAALDALVDALGAAARHAELPLLELTTEQKPRIAYVGPLSSEKTRALKLDIQSGEHVERIEQHQVRRIWSDLPDCASFDVYPVDEIAAEKLRCVIQRMQCRDLYDLHRLSTDLNVSLDEVRPLFERKTQAKGLDPSRFAEYFERRLPNYRRTWEGEMGDHVSSPPPFDKIHREVRRNLRQAGLLTA